MTATNAFYVALRGMTVNKNIALTGGGGGAVDNSDDWSIKGNTISGNLTISDVAANWLGVQFNTISNNAVLTNITATDPGDDGRAPWPSWRTRSGITSTARDSPQPCPQASSPARPTTSDTTRTVSAQRSATRSDLTQ